jgi:hypothetical protein
MRSNNGRATVMRQAFIGPPSRWGGTIRPFPALRTNRLEATMSHKNCFHGDSPQPAELRTFIVGRFWRSAP